MIDNAWSRERLVRDVRGSRFVVQDDTGAAEIDARGAILRVLFDHVVPDLDRATLADPALVAEVPDRTLLAASESACAVAAHPPR